MSLFIEMMRNSPYGTALLALLLASCSPQKKNPSVIRGLLYLSGYLISIYLLVLGTYNKSSAGAATVLVLILIYQASLIKKIRGENTLHDLSIFVNMNKIFPNTPTWINKLVPAVLIIIVALFSLKVIYSILTM